MDNRKTKDYIILQANTSESSNINLRIKLLNKERTERLEELYRDLEESQYDKLITDVHQYETVISNRENNQNQFVNFDFARKVKSSTIIELKEGLSDLKIKLEPAKKVNDQTLAEIKSLESEIMSASNFEGNAIKELERSYFEEKVLNLIKQGYEPLGGVSVTRYAIYQTMVKYE